MMAWSLGTMEIIKFFISSFEILCQAFAYSHFELWLVCGNLCLEFLLQWEIRWLIGQSKNLPFHSLRNSFAWIWAENSHVHFRLHPANSVSSQMINKQWWASSLAHGITLPALCLTWFVKYGGMLQVMTCFFSSPYLSPPINVVQVYLGFICPNILLDLWKV